MGDAQSSLLSKNNGSKLKMISVIPEAINYSIDQAGEMLWHQLDHFVQELNSQNDYAIKIEGIKIGTVTTLMGTMSIGYVTWVLRGGTLLAGMLSHMPTWRSFDPLPVLESWKTDQKKSKRDQDKEEDEIERKIKSFLH